jgi:hypothetical protein
MIFRWTRRWGPEAALVMVGDQSALLISVTTL